jgi:hypothetical protein
MGLMVHSLENIPESARRDYFIYLLDYGWDEPISNALHRNFDRMAQLASKTKAVVIKGTEAHFQNEVMSWHHINNEDAAELLPGLLITNAHPTYFQKANIDFPGKRNILRVNDEYESMKLILIPFRKFCTTTEDVVSVIDKVFKDIAEGKDLADFKVAKEMKKGIGQATVDAIILEPNFSGLGFNIKKFLKSM